MLKTCSRWLFLSFLGASFLFLTNANAALYAITTNYPVGNIPVALCLGDLRGNGLSRDLAVANSGDNSVSVRLCLDDGTFGQMDTYAVGNDPQSICYLDVNGDGMDDLATANFNDGTVSVLINEGVGANFRAATNYVVGANPNPGPKCIVTFDVNHDGRSDLVVANYNEGSVSVLTNTHGTGFSGLTNYTVGAGPSSVTVANLAHPGMPDIITANQTDGTLTILYGQTNGIFGGAQTVSYSTGDPQPDSVLPGDFNGDGIPDLMVANYNSNTVSLLAGQILTNITTNITLTLTNYTTNFTWQVQSNVTLNVGSHPVSIFYRPGGEDFNRDGLGDLAVLNEGDQTVSVFFGNTNRNFDFEGTFPAGNNPKAIWGSNFNVDGGTDFAVADSGNSNVAIMPYSGPLENSATVNVDELTASVPLTTDILDGDFLTYYIQTIPADGVLALNINPTDQIPITGPIVLNGPVTNLVFTPFTNFAGSDTLTFQVVSGIPQLKSLYSFTNGADGAGPSASLLWAGNGTFYGTTPAGGSNNLGTIFSATTNGIVTPLYSFTGGIDGARPYSALVMGPDGNLYGTASAGGSNSLGTIFQVTTNGVLTPLYSFTGGSDGDTPMAGVVFAGDGNLYGTASGGGGSSGGTIFQVTTNGVLTPLYSFTGSDDGETPMAGLVLGADGSLYGTTSDGGSGVLSYGTVFQVTTNGTFTPLYSFTGGSDGAVPLAGLVQGTDGSLYGTASEGGDSGFGTVFQVTTNGVLTPLYSFQNDVDGATPLAGLIQWSDSNLYGTASVAGTNGFGTVFEIGTNGNFNPLYSFADSDDGAAPAAGLTQAGGKYLYGSTAFGGSNALNFGTLFKILPGSGVLTSAVGTVTLKITSANPKAAFSFPANNAELTSNNITLVGTASDDAEVTRVFVSLNGGGFTAANITNSTLKAATWGLPLTLAPGTNIVQAQSMDYVSNFSAVVTEKIFYREPTTLVIVTNGSGSIASTASASGTPTNGANLFIGRNYTVTATAAANYTFNHWDLVTPSTTNTSAPAKLTFAMQPDLTLTANFYTNAPKITVQPKSATVFQQIPAVFSVTAVGAGLTYQWNSNGVPVGGATSASYTNAAPNTNGVSSPTLIDYRVVVANGEGSITSSVAVLTVKVDTNRPAVAISTPASNAQVTTNSITATGTASDNASVTNVYVSLNGGAYQPASITNNPTRSSVKWGLPLSLIVGSNQISAYSADSMGNRSVTNTRSFLFAVPANVTVTVNGYGVVTMTNLFDSVTPTSLVSTTRLFVNRIYTLTATAAHNNLFSSWVDNTDSTSTNSAQFTFTAQSNLSLTVNFVTNRFLPFGGTYYGLFSDTNHGVTESNAGWFTATVTPSDSSQSFSGSLFVDGDSLSGITGTFDLNGKGTATRQVVRQGKPPLTVSLQLNFDDTIGGTVANSGNWTSTVSGDLSTYSTAHPSPVAGTYNLLVPGFTNVAVGPSGYSYLTLKITGGSVTASGSLADGQGISGIQAAGISTNGDVPVYAKAYTYAFNTVSNGFVTSYAGALMGWLNFSNSTPSGDLFWLKTAAANNIYYVGGFSNETSVVGSIYTNTPSGLLITNGLVTLSGGNLTTNITDNVSVSNAVVKILGTPNQLTALTFTPSSGAVSGTFTNTGTHTVTALKGLYLNLPGTNNIIGGWFLGTREGGSLLVQPQ